MDMDRARAVLMDLLLEGRPLTEMVEACAGLLGAPVLFVFHGGPEGFLASVNFPYAEAYNSLRLTENLLGANQTNVHQLVRAFEARHGLEPFIYQSEEFPYLPRRLVCVCCADGRSEGLLSIPETAAALEEIPRPLAGLCARCLALCLRYRRDNRENTFFQRAVRMLLGDRHSYLYEEIAGEAGDRMPPRTGEFQLLRCLPAESSPGMTLQVLRRQLELLLNTEWVYADEREIALLAWRQRVDDELRAKTEELLLLSRCRGWLSPVFYRVDDAPVWRRRLIQVVPRVQARIGRVARLEDCLDWALFSELRGDPAALADFLPEELRALRAWDAEHGGACFPTLAAYFANGLSRRRTASAMGLHVNTVNYRLQKMEELFGFRLEAPDALFRYPFALRLIQYLDSAAEPAPREADAKDGGVC